MAEEHDDLIGLPHASFRALARMRPSADNCKRLWQRVVRRLVQDAFGNTGHSDPNDHDRAMRSARLWFRYDTDHVEEVFDLADVADWRSIRREVIKHVPDYRSD